MENLFHPELDRSAPANTRGQPVRTDTQRKTPEMICSAPPRSYRKCGERGSCRYGVDMRRDPFEKVEITKRTRLSFVDSRV